MIRDLRLPPRSTFPLAGMEFRDKDLVLQNPLASLSPRLLLVLDELLLGNPCVVLGHMLPGTGNARFFGRIARMCVGGWFGAPSMLVLVGGVSVSPHCSSTVRLRSVNASARVCLLLLHFGEFDGGRLGELALYRLRWGPRSLLPGRILIGKGNF